MNKSVYLWVVEALRQYPVRSATLVFLSVLTSLADGLSISLLIPFLATLFSGGGLVGAGSGQIGAFLGGVAHLAGEGNEVMALALAMLGLVALRSVLGLVEGLVSSQMSADLSHNVRAKIYANLLSVDFEYICVNDNGKLLNTLDSETWRTTEAVTTVMWMITNICMITVLTTILFLISWQLTLMVAVMVSAISLFLRLFDARRRVMSRILLASSEDLSGRAVQLFDAMRMIRAFGGEKNAQVGYERASRRALDISMRMERISGFAGTTQEILYACVFVAVIFIALSLRISGAALIAYLALLHRVQPHVKALDEARGHLASLSASIGAVSELLSLRRWNADSAGARTLPGLQDAIRFEHVTFAYRGKDAERRNALEDVSLTIPIGSITAIVGVSGAGKTTLGNLLFRFHDPLSGRITVDGVPLAEIDLSWWRSQLSIAGQDADLINGTIRDNIAYGLPDVSQDAVVDAARKASADAFISALPRGYSTRVGERGILLSGGQRQRIGLARALIRGGGVLVLDEATNSLDSMTESEVLASLEALHGSTVIVIAHRLSTTRMADQIVVLAGGRVVELGAPAALYESDGLFAKMVKLQELSHIVGGSK